MIDANWLRLLPKGVGAHAAVANAVAELLKDAERER